MKDQKQTAEVIVGTVSDKLTLTQSPANFLQQAISNNLDLDKIDKLMGLYERWQSLEAKKEYVKAMAAFKKDPPKIIKDMNVDFTTSKGRTTYRHASIGNVVGSITEALSKHDMSINWQTAQKTGMVEVTCTNTHIEGHSESITIAAPPDLTGSKNNIQAIGSTITYLQRYTLLAITGLATNEFETDGRIDEKKQEIKQTGVKNPLPKKQQSTKIKLTAKQKRNALRIYIYKNSNNMEDIALDHFASILKIAKTKHPDEFGEKHKKLADLPDDLIQIFRDCAVEYFGNGKKQAATKEKVSQSYL